jgi:signal transduction histidine kinase
MAFSNLQHDLRQPLTTLRTFMRHLPSKKEDEAFMKDFYEFTGQALDRLEALVDQMDEREK